MPNSFISKKNGKRVYVTKNRPIDETYLMANTPAGTKKFRALLEMSLSADVELLSLSSWNLYNLSNNLNPEIHNGYALSSLLSYYINQWNEKENKVEEEMTYVAFRNLYPDEIGERDKFTIKTKKDNYKGEAMIA